MGCRPRHRPLLTLLGWAVFTAAAQGADIDLKSMILMPGPLTEAHAREEKQCDSCHSRFDKSAQDTLCLNCHEKIASDRATGSGFHGRSPLAGTVTCKRCHTDHKGRDFDIAPLDTDIFDHAATDFPLAGKHTGASCADCHRAGTKYRETGADCHDCHEDQDRHQGALGQACGDCHTPRGWSESGSFEHGATDFPLRGRHASLPCSACHAGEQYQFDDTGCSSCHKLRDVHRGRYGQDCARCHNEEQWDAPVFDHAAETAFRLTGAHARTACKACHFEDPQSADAGRSTACVSCHRGNDAHNGGYGDDCSRCHGTERWQTPGFDHSREAGWPLLGKHQSLTCLQCHKGALAEPLPTDCRSCHALDDVHQSTDMADCSACHQSTDWGMTAGFDHELSPFPLEGMHAITPCGNCHEAHDFGKASHECSDCHGMDDAHGGALGDGCHQCHNPNGWTLWTFDHDTATNFELTGAHEDLSCGSCHRGVAADDVSRDCAGCHARDDRHEGRFGEGCSGCHTTTSFGDIQWRR